MFFNNTESSIRRPDTQSSYMLRVGDLAINSPHSMKASHWVSKCGVHEPSAFQMSTKDTSVSCTVHMCCARRACTLTIPPVVITGSYLCVYRREGFYQLCNSSQRERECTQHDPQHTSKTGRRGQASKTAGVTGGNISVDG